jgi:hypothetical protein
MLRFSSDFEWWKLTSLTGAESDMHSFEFSTDMNHVWCGNGSKLRRISGLANAYTKEAADISFKPSSDDTLLLISNLPSANLVTISPKPSSQDTLLLASNMPANSDSLAIIRNVDLLDSLILFPNIPFLTDSLVWIDSIPGSNDSLVYLANIKKLKYDNRESTKWQTHKTTYLKKVIPGLGVASSRTKLMQK